MVVNNPPNLTADVINRDSKLPLYQQLYEVLRGNIVRGAWQPGDRLPPESELIAIYQVSRITVRQVLDMLTHEGLIHRQRGRGTFVAHPPIEANLVRIVSFTEDMRRRGYTPGTKVLALRLLDAPEDIAEKLQVDVGEPLAGIERLRLADGEPMSVEESYLVHRYCPGVLDQDDYAAGPLRQALERHYGLRLVRAKQTIRAILAPRRFTRLLELPRTSALLLIERVSFSDQGAPVEFLRIYYRADRYTLYNELQG
ncbi:MAG: GntR family transcriptional regulator [Anaerolineae bacterium]|nr:GntR family transcriptional regulator [Anaerolineae bacterium]